MNLILMFSIHCAHGNNSNINNNNLGIDDIFQQYDSLSESDQPY